ncbi:hypothetical protein OS493_034134 [Desmophyllum pertusum]|uniref:Cilia- and flagella-associated protein 126 n=1 Tax=Desmophyllum pertusum TaxID=174260 RepID=A0A9X0CCW8_9CNID|nr:hypothetical protein OS493_034134 [Desmophyllum pertusum]
MSTHFSANQYDQAFDAQRLQNWEIPQRYKERPSALEGFTQPIANNRGHILPGIPRSSKSPWGEFLGTWDMTKPPLRTKTMKTTAMSTSMQKAPEAHVEMVRTTSPKHDGIAEKARTPSPLQEAMRTPSPKVVTPERGSPRPPSQNKKSPSPTQVKTPDPPTSPTQDDSSPKKKLCCVIRDPV